MAGSVTNWASNSDLTDYLVRAQLIKTREIERVFRVVDRANYVPPEHKVNAYIVSALKSGNIHISSPHIYGVVMEHLRLSPGVSFLNIGSGTGYLSTMVGLVIGSSSINHGVEIHADAVEYANQKLRDSNTKIPTLNVFPGFCEPVFVKGNGLCLSRETSQYDRVYCGAACPENFEGYMKNLIKVGGVLVMPLNNQLLQITRISDRQWEQKSISGVIFAPLQVPTLAEQQTPIKLPEKIIRLRFAMPLVRSVQQNTTGQHKSPTNDLTKNSHKDSKLFPSSSSEEDEGEDVTEDGIEVTRRTFTVKREKSDDENMDNSKSEQLENLKQIVERLQELSECPVCFGTMDSTLIQCKNGHGLCSTCASRIDKCPTCKREFVVYQSTLLGKILESLPKICPYIDKGCSEIVMDEGHEAFCKFRPSICRNTLCDWSGCVKDLIRHVKTCGKSKVCAISSRSKVQRYFPIDETQNMFYAPIFFQNQLFWEYFHRDVKEKRIAYKFYHVATSKPTNIYYFKVSFKKGKIEYVNSFRAFLDAKNDKSSSDETGIHFPNKELERFQSTKESGKYEYSIEVVAEAID